MRKIEEQERKNKNVQFVNHLKHSVSRPHNPPPQQLPSLLPSTLEKSDPESRRRSPTKGSEKTDMQEFTPELSRKKEYLKKIRHLKFVKGKADVYEQSLM
jgi:hypothetical protein